MARSIRDQYKASSEMMTCSIDPSINNCGFAIFKDKTLIQSGVIKTPKALDPYQKVVHIVSVLHEMLSNIDTVVLEIPPAFTYGRSSRGNKGLNNSAIQKLNFVVGGIIAVARIKDCDLYPVLVSQWKGRRSKVWDQLITGIKDPDAADAVGLGQYWLRIGRQIMEKT